MESGERVLLLHECFRCLSDSFGPTAIGDYDRCVSNRLDQCINPLLQSGSAPWLTGLFARNLNDRPLKDWDLQLLLGRGHNEDCRQCIRQMSPQTVEYSVRQTQCQVHDQCLDEKGSSVNFQNCQRQRRNLFDAECQCQRRSLYDIRQQCTNTGGGNQNWNPSRLPSRGGGGDSEGLCDNGENDLFRRPQYCAGGFGRGQGGNNNWGGGNSNNWGGNQWGGNPWAGGGNPWAGGGFGQGWNNPFGGNGGFFGG